MASSGVVVLDTDAVSFLSRVTPGPKGFLPHLQNRQPVISFTTEAEIEQWVIQARWGSLRVERFREFMMRFVTIPSSRDLILKWAEVMVAASSVVCRIEAADDWIAATALLYDAPDQTHNPTDYAGVPGLRLVSGE